MFFSVEIKVEGKHCFEAAGDFCFRPLRYLWKGKCVTVKQDQIVNIAPSNTKSKPKLEKLYLILLLIPGIVVGTLAKCFATLSESVRVNRKLVYCYLGRNLPSPIIPPFRSLHAMYAQFSLPFA